MKNGIIRRTLALALVLALCLPLCMAHASAVSYTRVSKVSRDDGTWLFPVASKYYDKFTDWAGCPGNGKCGMCGERHAGWGDEAHTNQAPLGHNGIDIGVPGNTSVYAAAAGTVVYTGSNSQRGKYMIVEHPIAGSGYSYYSYYQHLNKFSVSKGKKVDAGTTIAKSGNTGIGAYHLHFGIVMAKSGTNIGSRLGTVEGKGWLRKAGYAEKRILNNPSVTSAFPKGGSNVLPPLAAHSGSVNYTFEKSQVSIGTPSPGTDIQLTGATWPTALKVGEYFTLKGVVASGVNITSLTAGVFDSASGGTMLTGKTVAPNSTSYDIKNVDSAVKFNLLKTGVYYYRISAANSAGTKILLNQRFTVGTPDTSDDPAPSKPQFTDVPADMWYAEPVSWAVENGVTNGMSDTQFKPDNNCTRAQIVTFLWRANGSPEPTSTVNPFVDVPKDQYYYKAVLWAVKKNITTGIDQTHFKPDNICKRGQAVTFLWRAAGEPVPTSSENPFADVPKGQFYHDAVLWAVEKNITTGTTATTFKPDNTCTRGHIVTFLYRALVQ